jgi:hypothetical protein
MLLNPKPAGQSANAAIGQPFNSNAQYPGSHRDAFSSWDLASKISESQSGRAKI